MLLVGVWAKARMYGYWIEGLGSGGLSMGSDVNDLMAFFRQHRDYQFCTICLAFEFRLTFPGVDSALVAVGRTAALTEFLGRCALCGHLTRVTGLDRRRAASPETRILRFVFDHAGRFFCHVCVARRLQLNIGTLQKAVSYLRESPDVRIDDMVCSGCHRHRRVLGGVDRLDQAS